MTALSVLLLALAAGAAPPKRAKDQTVKLAAPGLQAVNLPREKAEAFMEHFNHQLTERQIRVITAKEVNAVLGLARTQQLLGCPEEETSCMMELADALGVDGLISGSIGKYGKTYQASITVVSSGDSRLLSSVTARADSEKQLLERLTAAAWKAASEIGEVLRRPTRKYVQDAISIDLGAAFVYRAVDLTYEHALNDRWSLQGDVSVILGQPFLLDASNPSSALSGTEIDIRMDLRHHFFDLAPLGLYVGGGLSMLSFNASGFVPTQTGGQVAAVLASTAFALSAEVGYAYALFDLLFLRAGLVGLLGAGLLIGTATDGGLIGGYFPLATGRLRVSVGFAF
jgi:hypothetical protein